MHLDNKFVLLWWIAKSAGSHDGVRDMSSKADRKVIVCPCHDVTRGDIEDAIAAGHTDAETVKRATAVYMGSCQGKFCSPVVQRLLAEHGVERSGEQRRPAARLPITPVPLGMLVSPEAMDPDTEQETAR